MANYKDYTLCRMLFALLSSLKSVFCYVKNHHLIRQCRANLIWLGDHTAVAHLIEVQDTKVKR